MKKSKLIMSIITCCFALSVLAFGVYASLSVSFNLSGTISFDPNGVDATITTQVFKYEDKITHDDAYLKAYDLQSKDFDTLLEDYENLTDQREFNTKIDNTYYPNLEQDLSGSVLNFEDCNAYFIVVYVLPNESYDLEEHNQIVFVELTQQELPEDNVWLAYNDKYLVIYPSAQQDGGLSMVFFIGITEPYIAVPENNFSLNLSFEYKDIFVPSDPENQIGSYENGLDINIIDEDIQTLSDFVLPEQIDGVKVGSFWQNSDNYHNFRKVILSRYISSEVNYDEMYSSEIKFICDQRNIELSSLDDCLYNNDKSMLISAVEHEENFEFKTFVKQTDSGAFINCNNLSYTIDSTYGGKYLPSKNNEYFALVRMDETREYETDFVLNKNCKMFGAYACRESNITSFDFNGADIKEIPDSMFYYCSSLTNITIPDSVTSIGSRVFDGCNDSIFTIDSTYGGKYISSESNAYFALVEMYRTKTYDTNFKLNSNCKVIAGSACAGSDITSFDFNGVEIKDIPSGMFQGCDSLKSITIPDSVISIENYAFQGTDLNTIYIPKNVQTMKDNVFFEVKNFNFKIYCEIQERDISTDWNIRWVIKDYEGNEWTDITWGMTREDYLKEIGK